MSLEHLVPEEGKYSEEKHNSPRRWECRGGGVDRGANRGTPEGQRQSQFSNRTVVLDHDPKHKIKKYPRGQPDKQPTEKETGRIHVALQLPRPQGRGAPLLGCGWAQQPASRGRWEEVAA